MKHPALAIALWPVLAGAPAIAAAATCPFDVPVVNLPTGPHSSGFNWSDPIRPLGDACVEGITVDPTNDKVWYVSGGKGLYVTHNGGVSWTHPLTGHATGQTVMLAPGNPAEVYVGHGTKLSRSTDKGLHWTTLHTFPVPIASVLVGAGGKIWVGPSWAASPLPNRIFFSPDKGAHWQALTPFSGGFNKLICWDIERDPQTGILYVATELANHPQPYHPPFFRSQNNGQTWTNVAGTLPTHVIALQLRPADGYLYALTEGAGLYGSANHGATWIPPMLIPGPTGSLLMNRNAPKKLYGGQQKHLQLNGGAFISVNAGKVFHPIGLVGASIGGLSLSGSGKKVCAAAYASGIYVSPVPVALQP